ncbi:sirohydrochlorin cobaltochelatase [Sulfurovum sp. TSL6]|uniref:sirohydrochlorin chelatase n=1 Tax=Sulfurovum sp. TSL6 TaxID=2826995 RepID=UPI001CC62ADF|nr:CbiX/SirB N-terminal domain-containing protein [Sulfurovum sp. TSL6]GIT99926.1 sirohydrochlorin cobaltochelatase [Sulfurovum sp. TSL6]
MADRALIIVAHGSRKNSSNEEVKALGEKVKSIQDKHYTLVMTSFLEFVTPSLEESILSCIDKGVSEIVILPYFLASGNHVTRDIPEVVQKIQASHPQVKITLKEHLGSASGMVKLLSDMAAVQTKNSKTQ